MYTREIALDNGSQLILEVTEHREGGGVTLSHFVRFADGATSRKACTCACSFGSDSTTCSDSAKTDCSCDPETETCTMTCFEL